MLVLAIFFGGCAISSAVGTKSLIKQGQSFDKVEYTEEHKQIVPTFDKELGYYVFENKDGREFKVLQFTDVHIGGGAFSHKKDAWAMNAVATMIQKEKPDFVVVTGDIAYPVPFQSGTFNNKRHDDFRGNDGNPRRVLDVRVRQPRHRVLQPLFARGYLQLL
ncbi:MAG: metallophosphoesterase [Clostridiales bacterium]|nr:MAG: metallophosphoesterase [Clostridiales bacterium]